MSELGQRAVLGVVVGSLRAARRARGWLQVATDFAAGMALAGLGESQRDELTRRIYDRPTKTRRGLFAWEKAWFTRDLPPPPAHILVGGAGNGREVRWLRAQGYTVLPFEPVEALTRACEGMLCGTYGDLVAPMTPQGRRFAEQVRAASPFDAVLMGWGSFNHVQPAPLRLAVLKALRDLSPGPVLTSFFGLEPSALAVSRAQAWGRRLGSLLAAPQDIDPADIVLPDSGYAHRFSKEEWEGLAAQAGYEPLKLGPEPGYPHGTLWPLGTRVAGGSAAVTFTADGKAQGRNA